MIEVFKSIIKWSKEIEKEETISSVTITNLKWIIKTSQEAIKELEKDARKHK
jgi:hypothetical protein